MEENQLAGQSIGEISNPQDGRSAHLLVAIGMSAKHANFFEMAVWPKWPFGWRQMAIWAVAKRTLNFIILYLIFIIFYYIFLKFNNLFKKIN
ncbi:MAG: hypothetical protein E6H10_15600 [Bacteroidetes bacterium]|nr:MAG: hypothetical protein E6H10_15600 [Bacteroidota bacterium]